MNNNYFFNTMLHLTGIGVNKDLTIEIFKLGGYPDVTNSKVIDWRDHTTDIPDWALESFINGLYFYRKEQSSNGIKCFNFPRSKEMNDANSVFLNVVNSEKELEKAYQDFEARLSSMLGINMYKEDVGKFLSNLGFIDAIRMNDLLDEFFDTNEKLNNEERENLLFDLLDDVSDMVAEKIGRSPIVMNGFKFYHDDKSSSGAGDNISSSCAEMDINVLVQKEKKVKDSYSCIKDVLDIFYIGMPHEDVEESLRSLDFIDNEDFLIIYNLDCYARCISYYPLKAANLSRLRRSIENVFYSKIENKIGYMPYIKRP